MATFQITLLFISICVTSNALFLPSSNTPEEGGGKLWFLENKFRGPQFDFIKQKIQAKEQAKVNGEAMDPNKAEIFEQKLAFLQNLWSQIYEQKANANHQVSKRSVKNTEESTSAADLAFGPAIGKYFLNQKMSFLENKFKDSLVDFEAIKEKIKAKKEAEKQAEIESVAVDQKETADDKFTSLLNFLKQVHAEKVKTHEIVKRSTKTTEDESSANNRVFGAAIGNHFLNQKLSFLENKFKDSFVDFDSIKQKIEAKKEAKLLEESKANAETTVQTNEKLLKLHDFFNGLSADQLAAIIKIVEGTVPTAQ